MKFYLRSQSMSEMADATISSTIQKNHHVTRKMVLQLYIQGILKAENLGLQCVGFDHELYNSLIRRFNNDNPSLKRKETVQVDCDRRVKRAKSSSSSDSL